MLVLFSLLFFLGYAHNSVRLSEVEALTFHKGEYTTARRTQAIPQLSCDGPACGSGHEPDVVRCMNVGRDDHGEVQWECKADLDNSVKFGKMSVSCEGYESSRDHNVLKGSCGLKYHLDYTGSGTHRHYPTNQEYYQNGHKNYQESSNTSFIGNLIGFLFVVFVVYFGMSACFSPRQNYGAPVPPVGGYPGGGYQGAVPPPAGGYPGGGYDYNQGAGYPGAGYGSYGNAAAAGGGNGFWSGLATGGVLSWLFSPQRNYGYGYNRYNGYAQPPPTYAYHNHSTGGGTRYSSGGSGSSSTSRTRTASGYATTSNR